MRKKVLASLLLVLLAVAVFSIYVTLMLHQGGAGRGRMGGVFFEVFVFTSIIPMGAVVTALALLLYYGLLPEMPYKQTEQAPRSRSEDANGEPPLWILRFLDDDEKKVFEVLRESGGSLLQKEIAWKTNYSKVKTHRVVLRLAKRGVVEVEKYFNTNKVTLKEIS